MNEIKCPNCGTIFQIDESDYESIVKQIRDKEFEKELRIRDEQHKLDKDSAVKVTEANLQKELTEKLGKKDLEIAELKSQLKVSESETESRLEKKYSDELNKKKLEISELKNNLKLKETEQQLELKDALTTKEKEIDKLNNKLTSTKAEYLMKEQNLKDSYEEKLKNKDDQIAYYKDFKARQSTKMIGESLEQHCSNEFNKLRPLFGDVYFEKDNEVKDGTKGDFIFREYDTDGTEIISIMFEMKNEADTTSVKHRNEDFFKKLDKDRTDKNCEYAVLVSLLEIDNELYNNGIVDVSYKYNKMYVIRPQFFIPLITLLRGASLNTLNYKKQLKTIQNQNIDISHFEENMNSFKETFGRNYRLASERFKKAIEEIDKTIDHLQKTKENLLKSEDNLRLANNKADALTIKKLTSNSPMIAKMFDDLKSEE